MMQENIFPNHTQLINSTTEVTIMKSLPDDNHGRTLSAADKQPLMGKALAIIILAFFFLRLLSIFLRVRRQPFPYYITFRLTLFLHQRWNRHDDDYGNYYYHSDDQQQANQQGVEPSVMDTFPVLRYSDVRELIRNRMLRETAGCAICLSDYIQGERRMLRLLPKCDHVFHLRCIDRCLSGRFDGGFR